MPSLVELGLVERLPTPSLRSYVVLSWLLLATVLAQAAAIVSDVDEEEGEGEEAAAGTPTAERLWQTDMERRLAGMSLSEERVELIRGSLGLRTLFYVLHDQLSVWVLVNWLGSVAALAGSALLRLTFRRLRSTEAAALRERFWNFLFYKFVFVFGVLCVEKTDEAAAWILWLTGIGLFRLLSSVCQDRLAYCRGGGRETGEDGEREERTSLTRVMLLTTACLLASLSFLVAAVGSAGALGLHYAAFLGADALELLLRNAHALVRFGPCSERPAATSSTSASAGQASAQAHAQFHYYAELYFQMALLALDFLHHLHMLLWSHVGLSMACLVIGLQLRQLWIEMDRKLRKHRTNVRILAHIQENFPLGRPEDESDACPICWEGLGEGRRLPCGHIFHEWCLRGWLDQDPSCPTCRAALPLPASAGGPAAPGQPAPTDLGTQFRLAFDGARYARWLPSFSVELTHNIGELLRPTPAQPISPSQLNSLATQVLDMFPQLDREAVLADLAQTTSLDLTIENALEGRLQTPPALEALDPQAGLLGEEVEEEEGADWSTDYESEGGGEEEVGSEGSDGAWEAASSREPYVSPSFSGPVRQARAALVAQMRSRYLAEKGLDEADLLHSPAPRPTVPPPTLTLDPLD